MDCPSMEKLAISAGLRRRILSVDFLDIDAEECADDWLDSELEQVFGFSMTILKSLS